ncbi:MAG: glutamyl-tRNA reductase [Acidimicrobiales bacterium]
MVVGLNHRTAPLELLERMTVSSERLPKALGDLVGREHVTEAVVLSTCNRIEVYVHAERFHGAVQDVRSFFAQVAFLPPEEFADHLYTFHDAAAVAQLLTVTAGLDSALVGESEILGQVKRAWERAVAEGATGPVLNVLFRHAVEAGKRVRTETGIGRHTTSVSQAAVALAAERLGTLVGRRVLVLGAGEMGEGMVAALARAGVGELLIANRTQARAAALADRVGGRALPLGELSDALGVVDVLLTSVGASLVMVEQAQLESVMAARAGRELLIVDVAVPRDVDPAVSRLSGVDLLDMDDLRSFAQAGVARRRLELTRARDLIDEEVSRYREAVTARRVAPLIATWRERVEGIRAAEVARLGVGLDPDARATLDDLSRGVVAKLLHEPTVRLKDAAGSVRAERLAEALRELFAL